MAIGAGKPVATMIKKGITGNRQLEAAGQFRHLKELPKTIVSR
jgi:hypothetical protein